MINMPCGKVFKFIPNDPRDIPLPEMVQLSIKCKSDKVYECFRGDENFVVIGSRNQDEAMKLCEESGITCEVFRSWEPSPFIKHDRAGSYPWTEASVGAIMIPDIIKTAVETGESKVYKNVFNSKATDYRVIIGASNREQATEVEMMRLYSDPDFSLSGTSDQTFYNDTFKYVLPWEF